MESTLHTLHIPIVCLIRISFSDFRFLVLMGGSAPLNPPIYRVGDRCMTDMLPDTLYRHSPLQTVICSPRQRRGEQGNQNSHGRKLVGEKPIL